MAGLQNSRSSHPLFSSSASYSALGTTEPLAFRMRPRILDEFVGQEHIVGQGRLLRRAIQKDQLSSVIFAGPPGTGKTTLARIIANTTKSHFITLNAVLSGVADLREAIDQAKAYRDMYSRKTILFVDEVHRWNKSQQDALLPWIENGTVILIGATTENPFFEVNRALLSRSRVFVLKQLTKEDLFKIARQALEDKERGYGLYNIGFEDGALEHIIETADGDARSLLNALELAIETSSSPWPPQEGANLFISMKDAEESIQRRAVLYDKDGDYHFDTISAFIKSVRGSDPDASLYWLARMIYAGEDPDFILRRLLILACEDIGLADPGAITVVNSCAQAFDRVGLPEGQLHLVHATLYCALAPKSNSILCYFDALEAVQSEQAEVPDHLKDSNRDKAAFGHGEGYQYPHAYREHWVAQQYLPPSLMGRLFYIPGSLGFEGSKRRDVLIRREAQLAIQPEDLRQIEDVNLVWSRKGESRLHWRIRSEFSTTERLLAIRTAAFNALSLKPIDNIVVIDPRSGFYTMEALRRTREGKAFVLLNNKEAQLELENLSKTEEEIIQPEVAIYGELTTSNATSAALRRFLSEVKPSFVILCEFCRVPIAVCEFLAGLTGCKENEFSHFMAFDVDVESSSRLSSALIAMESLSNKEKEFCSHFLAFEDELGHGPTYPHSGSKICSTKEWFDKMKSIISAAFDVQKTMLRTSYSRPIDEKELERWLDASTFYGSNFQKAFSESEAEMLKNLVEKFNRNPQWPLNILFFEF
ncbi:MAG: Replication-associated recombination protein A [Spirochaetes bacterium ADurb.Bin110]|nr:MAG: Replication-associated recombination protein A [Spirochaetes bacterium ADurb.Bin110]